MKLRTRLIVALFITSVVPLSAVTVFSYLSSRQAFENAVEAEARLAAIEMGQRMDVVTANLQQRIDRLWDVPLPAVRGQTSPSPFPANRTDIEVEAPVELDALLGSAASFLERIEIEPAAPPPPSAAPPARPGAASPTPHPPLPPGPSRKFVIDVSKWLKKKRATADASVDVDTAAVLDAVQQVVSAGLELGLKGAAAGLRLGAEELRQRLNTESRRAEEARRAGLDEIKKAIRERQLEHLVHRQGRQVGRINATLNMNRILEGVLSLPRRERGEVPFALDSAGRLHTQRSGDAAALRQLGVERQRRQGARRAGEWLVVTREDPSGITFGIAHPLGESLQEIRRASMRNLAIGLLFITVALVGIVPLSNGMTRSLSRLIDGVRSIARGDYSARVPIRSHDEFGMLGRAFNQMAKDVEAHQKLQVEQARLKRELELCRQIQMEMLPHEPLRLGLAEVKGLSIPAREVGGDFFNYFVMPGGDIALLVGDVSGKGVGAALLMANVQATLRARIPLESDLAKLIGAIDRETEKSTPRGVYFTLFVGLLDPTRKVMRYVNAGHNPQFVIRASTSSARPERVDGSTTLTVDPELAERVEGRSASGLEQLPSTGLPVGLYAGHGYREREIALADGDLLFFYTDGAVEVENEGGEMFGAERLEQLLLREHASGIDVVLDRVEQEIRGFRGTAEPFDDATIMALRVGATPAAVVA